MDKYTEKFFFEEIRDILDARPIDKICPYFLYRDADGNIIGLHSSGNKLLTHDLSEAHYLLQKWMRDDDGENDGRLDELWDGCQPDSMR